MMFRRLIALFLMLVLPVQGMGTPHAHTSDGLPEPDGHAARPHFHVGRAQCSCAHHRGPHADHDQHDHDAASESEHDPTHDETAIYVSDEIAVSSIKRVEIPSFDLGIWIDVSTQPSCELILRPFPLRDRPPDPGGGCPLYLRVLSLRI